MKGKILVGSFIALAIAIVGLAGTGIKTASAQTYPISSFACATVTFSPFGNCINGIQTRDIIDKTPINCAPTSDELAGRSQVCGKVLGVKIYAAGSLLRTPEGKIYVVTPGQSIKLIPDLNALQAYRGRDIHDVSDALISQYILNYGQVLGVKIFANGTLLRSPDSRIYVVTNGALSYISSLDELSLYAGRHIYNISWATLAGYQQISGQVLGVKIYGDGTLLRGPDHKIYVVENGRLQYISSLEELYQFRNTRIINVSASVLADFQ